MGKTFLFIDGSNLYGAQFELFGPRSFLDFSKFIKEVEKGLKLNFDKIYFYASYSPKTKKPTKKQKSYLKNEGLFYKSVRETKNVEFFKGYRSPTSGKEKEVDVKLAADLVDMAHRKKFNQVFLLTGDADFLQALLIIKKLNCWINILCLENRIMYQGVFRFRNYILSFSGKEKKIRKNIKLNIIKLDKNCISEFK